MGDNRSYIRQLSKDELMTIALVLLSLLPSGN